MKTSAWSTHELNDGIVELVFDLPDRAVNVFSVEVMKELRAEVRDLALRPLRALILRSGKASFIAGADIGVLADIEDRNDGVQKARLGQDVFDALAALPYPTFAMIHGACMGGGLEFALACSYRIATDADATRLGLPEVKLGIVPGWGGTQRLTRLIGMEQSLRLVTTGRPVSAKAAYRIGLVDALLHEEFVDVSLLPLVEEVLRTGQMPARHRREAALARTRSRLIDHTAFGQALLRRSARRMLAEKTAGRYPAPMRAVDLIAAAARGQTLSQGLHEEAEVFGDLVESDVSRELVRLFLTQEELKRRQRQTYGATGDTHHAGVIGAGLMGGQIAWLLSHHEHDVRLKDVAWEPIAKGCAAARDCYRELERRRKLRPSEAALRMQRISGCVDHSGFSHLDWVIEAVVENMDVKQTVLRDVEAAVPTHAVLCTNTSALSVTEMASVLQRPEQFAGFHFFNPVTRMPLVEVIPTEHTSPETMQFLVGAARKLGKTPLVVKDCPGFLVNRILIPFLNECGRMLGEGTPMTRIDEALLDYGFPMGPFRLIDEVGLAVGLKVSRILEKGYGDRMLVAPLFAMLENARDLVGRATGRGFYLYGGRRRPNPDIGGFVEELTRRDGRARRLSRADIVERAMGIMVNESCRCMEEGVVARPELLDLGMILGAGFPPYRGGPLREADRGGLRERVASLETLQVAHGDRFAPCARLKELAREGTTFHRSEPVEEGSFA